VLLLATNEICTHEPPELEHLLGRHAPRVLIEQFPCSRLRAPTGFDTPSPGSRPLLGDHSGRIDVRWGVLSFSGSRQALPIIRHLGPLACGSHQLNGEHPAFGVSATIVPGLVGGLVDECRWYVRSPTLVRFSAGLPQDQKLDATAGGGTGLLRPGGPFTKLSDLADVFLKSPEESWIVSFANMIDVPKPGP
jgi:hypothetical protein